MKEQSVFEDFDLVFKLTKQLSAYFNKQQSVLLEYDRIVSCSFSYNGDYTGDSIGS